MSNHDTLQKNIDLIYRLWGLAMAGAKMIVVEYMAR